MEKTPSVAVLLDDFPYHYGPTESDADPGKKWHIGCGGEVLFIEDGLICAKCGAQAVVEPDPTPADFSIAPDTPSDHGAGSYYHYDERD